ncbi:tetratricopeptide repeat protein [Sphingobium estronivorans]|uniref:tetratricopeptide repeat protein n=1 Tax=Sphingobium estronivorans TaxID=1577690 RepID=UPI00123A4E5E|nr:tetratricopeptide repeat protein [Sphingobium estronivorans]
MRMVAATLGLVLASLAPTVAFAAPDEVVVVGVPDGRLAAGALASGDYAHAAQRLEAVRPDAANDPARLINLGNAYAGMGKMKAAHAAYKAARFAPDSMLVTADGNESSSRDIARRAMGRLEAQYAMR